MEAYRAFTEKERGVADYGDCVDDDLMMIDDDETVCDDDRDGLTLEEAKAYEEECRMLSEFKSQMRGILGWQGWLQWCKALL